MELKTGYVVLCDYQYFNGYTIFCSKTHTNELHKLNKSKRDLFLKEMALVAQAVINAFKPKKLNYELLGNSDSHLHWHLIPRYGDDPSPKTAIWAIDQKIRCNKKNKPSEKKLKELKEKITKELNHLI
jgi:diadenosine tetraphosphate (Ap4A) HIT family hydrolase